MTYVVSTELVMEAVVVYILMIMAASHVAISCILMVLMVYVKSLKTAPLKITFGDMFDRKANFEFMNMETNDVASSAEFRSVPTLNHPEYVKDNSQGPSEELNFLHQIQLHKPEQDTQSLLNRVV